MSQACKNRTKGLGRLALKNNDLTFPGVLPLKDATENMERTKEWREETSKTSVSSGMGGGKDHCPLSRGGLVRPRREGRVSCKKAGK